MYSKSNKLAKTLQSRGDIGLGLGDLGRKYSYSTHMHFDELKKAYVGHLESRSGLYEFEGPDRTSITMQIEQVLNLEYDEMMHELASEERREFGLGIEKKFGNVKRREENGKPIITIGPESQDKPGPTLAELLHITQVSLAVVSIIQGAWVPASISAASMMIEHYLTKVSHVKKQTLYKVAFGGIVITAVSRRMLKKKLQQQRNKRIQLIMNHMRGHDKGRKEASSTGNLSRDISGRLLEKKTNAKYKWQLQISPQGQETGWRDRSVNLRRNLEAKRERAQTLWTQRAL